MSRHGRLESLFLECAALPRSEWEAHLAICCAGDPGLRADVLDLLRRDLDPSAPTLDPFVSGSVGVPAAAEPARALPGRIGPYRILRRLGEGGFGEVFEAEQERPVRRRVALKVLKAGMDTRAVLARFAVERQALALMDHPSVARVLDAGETEAGRPYVAMELVDGESITDYADRTGRTLRERIEILIAVCRAVEHAHQKGVIHRDLKPSNILVAEIDGRPVPRVIDFGIAKATAVDPEQLETRPGEFLGTPEYMSPEQAQSGGIDVDTRTDVYSLGVLLYRLLTGALPFGSESMRRAGPEEVRRILREVDPPRPSSVANGGRTLRGELDWIIIRAMEKERGRRYPSPAALADDLGRYLRHEPVTAAPPGAGYRLRTFVRRRRGSVIAAAAILLAVVSGVAATAYQAVRATRAEAEARRQAETAVAVNGFLTGMLAAANPAANPRGRDVTVREIVAEAAAGLDRSPSRDPAVDAGIRSTLAATYTGLGLYDEAERHAKRALELRERQLGPAAPLTLATQIQRARLESLQGRHAAAEARLEAIVRLLPAGEPGEELRADLLQVRGSALTGLERFEAADSLLTEAVAVRRRRFHADRSALSPLTTTLSDLSELKGRRGLLDASALLATEAVDAARSVHGDEHHDVAVALGHLASVQRRLGRYAAAESLYRASIAIDRRVVGPTHPFVAESLTNLGIALAELGRPGEAEARHREALEILAGALPLDHPVAITVLGNLATAVQAQGRLEEALVLRRRLVEQTRRVHGAESEIMAIQLNNLASLHRLEARYAEAAPLFREAVAILERLHGPENASAIIARHNLGKTLLDEGRVAEAEAPLAEAIALAERAFPPGHPNTAIFRANLGRVCFRLGRAAEAESLLLAAHAALTASLGPEHQRTRDAAESLAELCARQKRPAEARRWRASAGVKP